MLTLEHVRDGIVRHQHTGHAIDNNLVDQPAIRYFMQVPDV